MKRIFLAVAILTLVLPALRQVEAGIEVSVDFFYDNLGADGNWVELDDYGYCWQPSVAVSDSHWRPYADGYWAYTDVGWTWVSNEDFGWATYHYGRWTRLRDRGWFWVPGREWGPAWVSWRTGGDYVGWAPLPPRGVGEVAYDSSPITGQVDVEFDIGPAYYNFVDVRYIGEPVLRERIFEPSSNITYITQTVNVTNITYANSTVYNYGPDYTRLSQYSTRPIRRMTLEHDANTDLSVAAKSNKLTRVQGDKLIVAAPLTIQKAPNPIAPKVVKEKIAKPTIEHGWGGVPDPKAQADLKQKMKNENPKDVPPPSIKPHDNPVAAQSPASVFPQDKNANKDMQPKEAPGIPHQPSPPNRQAPINSVAKPSLPPERVAPPKQAAPSDIQSRPPLPPERVAPPQQEAPPDSRPKRPLPPERVAPPKPEAPPDSQSKRPLPPERVAPPKQEAPPDSQSMRPLPPERVAPPKQEAQPQSQPKRPPPPERVAPPTREAPPEVSHKQPPPERIAPPPGPGGNGPVKTDVPHTKRPPDKKEMAPTPPPGS